MNERLVKIISASGAASRRAAGDLVKAGRIAVNGKTVLEPGVQVAPDDVVTLDGNPLRAAEKKYYIMLHKPRGYVCTNSDPHAEHKAVDLIQLEEPVRLFSAGRLDKESEGLILFSNDGDYVARLTHPRYEILKTYHVRVNRPIPPDGLERIRRGIEDDGEFLKVHSIKSIGPCRYEVILNEGKKREIRRLTAAAGATTVELRRVKVGRLELGGLTSGKFRILTPEEAELSLYSSALT